MRRQSAASSCIHTQKTISASSPGLMDSDLVDSVDSMDAVGSMDSMESVDSDSVDSLDLLDSPDSLDSVGSMESVDSGQNTVGVTQCDVIICGRVAPEGNLSHL